MGGFPGRRSRLSKPAGVPAPRPPGEPGAEPDAEPTDPGPPPLPHPRTDPAPPSPDLADEVRGAYARARAAVNLPKVPTMREHRVSVTVEVDDLRMLRSATQCTRWDAKPDADAFEVVTLARVLAPGGRPARERPTVEAVRGCRACASYTDVRAGLSATRMELDAPVTEGRVETVHRVTWAHDDGAPPVTGHEVRLPASFDAACIEVRFTPGTAPTYGEGFLRPADGADGSEDVVPLELEEGCRGPVLRLHRSGPAVPDETRAEHPEGVVGGRVVVVGVRWTW